MKNIPTHLFIFITYIFILVLLIINVNKFKTLERKTNTLITVTEDMFETTRIYILDKYSENLDSTLYQENTYQRWYTAYEDIICF